MGKTIILSLVLSFFISGCGQPLITDNKTYPTYGLFNEDTMKSKDVCYAISIGNVVLSIVFVETIIAPIYFVGWDLYAPVRKKKDQQDKCTIDD